jgi:hypothetical protein
MSRGLTIVIADKTKGELVKPENVERIYTICDDHLIHNPDNAEEAMSYPLIFKNHFTSGMMDLADILYLSIGSKDNDTKYIDPYTAEQLAQAINYCLQFHDKDEDGSIRSLLNNPYVDDIGGCAIYVDDFAWEWKNCLSTLQMYITLVNKNECYGAGELSLYIQAWG